MAYLIKTLTLEFDDGAAGTMSAECQLSTAEIVDAPDSEDVTTFCGTETFATPKRSLHIAGYQDWGNADPGSICEVVHAAYIADPTGELTFTLTVGTATRSGTCKPTADMPFGGSAGSALTFDTSLDIVGDVVDGVAP